MKTLNLRLTLSLIAVCLLSAVPIWSQQSYLGVEGYVPTQGFVPDAATATKIARAVLVAQYGQATIDSVEPLKAALVDDKIWVVKGSLKKGELGGTPYLELQKSDGKILKLVFGK